MSESVSNTKAGSTLVVRPDASITQFQVAALVYEWTDGQHKFILPRWSTLEKFALSKSGIMVTYVREYVREGTKSDTMKKAERITVLYERTRGLDGSTVWVKDPDRIRVPLKDRDKWTHMLFLKEFTDEGHDFDSCLDVYCTNDRCVEYQEYMKSRGL